MLLNRLTIKITKHIQAIDSLSAQCRYFHIHHIQTNHVHFNKLFFMWKKIAYVFFVCLNFD